MNWPRFGFWIALPVAWLVWSGQSQLKAAQQKPFRAVAELSVPYQLAEAHLLEAAGYLAPNQHARNTLANGEWRAVGAGDWTSGFYAGCQWLMFEETRDKAWKERASLQTADLFGQQFNTGDHDIGFRILASYGNAYRLTGDSDAKAVILNAAQSFATRFDPLVGCTRSWDFGWWQYPVIIDNLMNLELLFWAAQNGGDPNWQTMAHSHALRSLQEHVRPDGSTYHVVDFDPATGLAVWK
ncbi:MAG: glycoside hydrolase family 88 protein, partial [Planctomycetes bacterium]|nr:glycoside hydrolase family 88 protein [Planctomycetota bacterium]